MFCSKCGAQNEGGSAFCIRCGAPLANNAPSAPAQQPGPNPGYYAPPQAVVPPQAGMPPQTGNYAPQGYNQAPPGYYQQPGYGQARVKTAPKKTNYTLIGIIAVVVVVAIIALVLILVFKGGGNQLVGTWTGEVYGAEVAITFKKDGTVIANSMGEDSPAKYSVKGDKLTITAEDGSVSTGDYRIYNEDGKKALDMTFEGITLTLYKK
jgi:hypothetical protein